MASLFSDPPAVELETEPETDHVDRRELPAELPQLLIDLKAEYPSFRPYELAPAIALGTVRTAAA